ncbi:MAG TPA: hypothetical protein VGP72_32825 [Planctomycetota bacterium]|jgi:hypothetical protein
MKHWHVALVLSFCAAVVVGAADGVVRFDFESGDLQGWTIVEGQFGKIVTDRAVFHHDGKPYNKQGKFFLSTLESPANESNDQYTGVIESPVFTLSAPEMSFLVGGGNHADTYVALCTMDGAEVLKGQGTNSQPMQRVQWKEPKLVGKKVFLRIVDRNTGGWGHITFDDFQASGTIDPKGVRPRVQGGTLTLAPTAALRAAIEDIAATFGSRYPRAQEFLQRLEKLEKAIASENAEEAQKAKTELSALQREALTTNPLVGGQPLLFVVRKQYRPDHHNTETMFQTGEINTGSFQGGGALKTIDFARGGEIKTLWESQQGLVRDPDVYFDGKKMLVSIRKDIKDDYHLYEMNVDGSGLKQLTSAPGVFDIDPLYLPDDTIAFTSSREPKYCMCNRHIMGNLFRMNADGSNIRQIGKNTLFEGHGRLTPDGRIMYDRWEYVDRNFGDGQGLWVVNPDGTNHAIVWGNNTGSPGAVLEGRYIPGTAQILCNFSSCHDRPWGALAIVDPARGLDGRAPVIRTWPADAINLVRENGGFDDFTRVKLKFEDPYPLSDKYFLCSRMTGSGEQMGLFLVDVFGNEIMLHTEGPGCYDPRPIAARTRPPVIPARRDFENKEGYFYVADVYQGTHMQGVKPGSVKSLRVMESPEKRFFSGASWNGQGAEAPAMGWHDFNNKRILGTVPVEADGSAFFALPSDKFVFFQLLDENGLMIQSMRSGTMVQSGEWTGCIGCHDERRSTPPTRVAPASVPAGRDAGPTASALKRGASRLDGWYGPQRDFNYLTEVQPVFDRACVSCHDFDKKDGAVLNLARDRELSFNASYIELWLKREIHAIGAGPAATQPAYGWGSNDSKLVDAIRPLAGLPLNPRSKIPPQQMEKLRQAHEKITLTKEDFDRIATWIDINAPYYSSYASVYPNNLGGRCVLDGKQLGRLEQLTGVPLSGLGHHGRKLGPQVSFDRPEVSPCLSKFQDKNDPKYKEALAIIQAGRDMLKQRPNPDAPEFAACDADQKRETKYQQRLEAERRNRAALREGRKIFDEAK